MKIIFLDFDGVLNSNKFLKDEYTLTKKAYPLEQHLINRVEKIARVTKAKVVVSSAWRLMYDVEGLKRIIEGYSPYLAAQIIDKTPDYNEWRNRWKEIASWLAKHRNIESFVILDDIKDFGPLADHHIRCREQTGITTEQVHEAIDILKSKKLIKVA